MGRVLRRGGIDIGVWGFPPLHEGKPDFLFFAALRHAARGSASRGFDEFSARFGGCCEHPSGA
jgi:hypothetical protein